MKSWSSCLQSSVNSTISIQQNGARGSDCVFADHFQGAELVSPITIQRLPSKKELVSPTVHRQNAIHKKELVSPHPYRRHAKRSSCLRLSFNCYFKEAEPVSPTVLLPTSLPSPNDPSSLQSFPLPFVPFNRLPNPQKLTSRLPQRLHFRTLRQTHTLFKLKIPLLPPSLTGLLPL